VGSTSPCFSFGMRSSTKPARVSKVPVAIALRLGEPVGRPLAKSRRRSSRRPPTPSAARRRKRSCRAECRRRGPSPPAGEVHHPIGHLGFLGCGESSNPSERRRSRPSLTRRQIAKREMPPGRPRRPARRRMTDNTGLPRPSRSSRNFDNP
jgi:hypothetical protein